MQGFSFAVYAELDDSIEAVRKLTNTAQSAYLGQGKSAFLVWFAKASENIPIEEETRAFLKGFHPLMQPSMGEDEVPDEWALIYSLSDAFMADKDAKPDQYLYRDLLFAVTDTRSYRRIETKLEGGNRLLRHSPMGGLLYNLMKAGSLMIAPNEKAAQNWVKQYTPETANIIGYNSFIIISKEELR